MEILDDENSLFDYNMVNMTNWSTSIFNCISLVYKNDNLRIWTLGYYHNLQALYIRDIIIPLFGKDDYILIPEWGAIDHLRQPKLISKSKFKENIYWMTNCDKDTEILRSIGIQAFTISHNCFIDKDMFNIYNIPKQYNGIYNAAFVDIKRHYLTKKLNNLVYLSYVECPESIKKDLCSSYTIYTNVDISTIIRNISISKIGLILSESEGGCYAVTEYLYCGLPVLSTKSVGGRDTYLNNDNSIIVNDDVISVRKGFRLCLQSTWDPYKIRQDAIDISNKMLDTLKYEIIFKILKKYNFEHNIDQLFHEMLTTNLLPITKGRTVFQPERCSHTIRDIRFDDPITI